jgi:hypothetical protein
MNHQSFPSPPIDPLERLHVYDSLMMNAQRWLLAHEYHRRRQNVQYQSLNQPGIVCGLGVRLIDPPAEAPAKFRDRRWLEIQPGIAIDVEGNPIIVDQSVNREFRLAIEPPTTGTLTVYLVVSYVEPQNLEQKQDSEVIREWFRIDEKTTPPSAKEVELCRIKLQPGTIQLENPTDIFFPDVNQLDLRYRIQAKARPQALVRVALMTDSDVEDDMPSYLRRTWENLSYLMDSVAALYPALQGATQVGQATLQEREALADYDLLYLTDWQVLNLNEEEFETLDRYLNAGGVLLVEAPTDSADLIESIQTSIAQYLETPLNSWEELSRNHPLRTQPFLFAALPIIDQQPIQLWHGGGIVLLMGELSAAWGLDEELSLSRSDIRTAQELGINILHFAWRRQQLTQLLQ